jgi:hypothetical protein
MAGALVLKQETAANKLLATAMVSPPDANAPVATWGWFACGPIPGVMAKAPVLR